MYEIPSPDNFFKWLIVRLLFIIHSMPNKSFFGHLQNELIVLCQLTGSLMLSVLRELRFQFGMECLVPCICMVDSLFRCAARNSMLNAVSHQADDSNTASCTASRTISLMFFGQLAGILDFDQAIARQDCCSITANSSCDILRVVRFMLQSSRTSRFRMMFSEPLGPKTAVRASDPSRAGNFATTQL